MSGRERTILEVTLEPPAVAPVLLGPTNETLRLVGRELGVELGVRGNVVRFSAARGDGTRTLVLEYTGNSTSDFNGWDPRATPM